MEPLRIRHVKVSHRAGRVVLEVDDDELCDLIEDHLHEGCDLDYEWLERSSEGVQSMVFSESVSLDRVVAALNQLDPAEVDRVYRINNP